MTDQDEVLEPLIVTEELNTWFVVAEESPINIYKKAMNKFKIFMGSSKCYFIFTFFPFPFFWYRESNPRPALARQALDH